MEQVKKNRHFIDLRKKWNTSLLRLVPIVCFLGLNGFQSILQGLAIINSVIVVIMLVHCILSRTWMLLCICSFLNNLHDAIRKSQICNMWIREYNQQYCHNFFYFFLFLISWRILILQYCVGLCCTTTWTSELHALSLVCSPPASPRQQSPTRTYLKLSSLYTIQFLIPFSAYLWWWLISPSYEQVAYSFSFGQSSFIYTRQLSLHFIRKNLIVR